jgi:hypothetical protein
MGPDGGKMGAQKGEEKGCAPTTRPTGGGGDDDRERRKEVGLRDERTNRVRPKGKRVHRERPNKGVSPSFFFPLF